MMARRWIIGVMPGLMAVNLLAQPAARPATVQSTPAVASVAQFTPTAEQVPVEQHGAEAAPAPIDYWSMLFVFVLATFVGLGVVMRVSRLLHTPLMSLTNAISAIAVVGSIIVTGSNYPTEIRLLGATALFASMTNIVSGFLITDRMLKMFKRPDASR
jgi:NAD(P) transhydrogenase subunit alpha